MLVDRNYPIYSEVLILIGIISTALAEFAWPAGTYGLPEPVSGCPDFKNIQWKRGFTYHDTEDEEPANKRSENYHFAGNFSQHGIQQRFCIKDAQGEGSEFWPDGQYCIYKKGVCPNGLDEGFVKWDDEHSKLDFQNRHTGELPDGVYDRTQTLIKYCCNDKGNVNKAINLPNTQPFYLLTHNSAQCQKVAGTRVASEFIKFDDNDRGNSDAAGGRHPYGPSEDTFNTKIYYCYYEPGEESTDDLGTGKSVIGGRESSNGKSSSGLAVAIGCGVAGAIVGTASIAFATKRILASRAKDVDCMDEPMPDAP